MSVKQVFFFTPQLEKNVWNDVAAVENLKRKYIYSTPIILAVMKFGVDMKVFGHYNSMISMFYFLYRVDVTADFFLLLQLLCKKQW